MFPISVNIALGKPAYQSSTEDPLDRSAAGGAVDGSLANGWFAGDHCQHTLKDDQAWWAVDLGNYFTLDYVTITNRKEYGKPTLIVLFI